MIIHTERLEDRDGCCEIARKLPTYLEGCFIYDLIADTGYELDEGKPLCIVKDDGDCLNIVFLPYGSKGLRRKIKLDYAEADYLMKLLCYIDRRMEQEKNT